MDGLECSEVWLSDCEKIIDFRIDANTYKKDYVKTSKKLEDLHAYTIESQMKSIQNFGAYSLCNEINFVEQGIPFLVTHNIRHNYIDWNNIKYVDEKSHKILKKSHCHTNQVLVTMAGEYLGRSAVYDVGFISSSNQAIAKITFSADENPYFISTFLNTKYGQNQINRLKTITGQPNINMGLIKALLIPPASPIFANAIEGIVRQCTECMQNSKQIYAQAEQLLLDELGMINFSLSEEKVSIKNFSDSFGTSGRFDAEYYQTKYEQIEKALLEPQCVGQCCKLFDSNYIPSEKMEYKYIELSNIGTRGDIDNVDTIVGLDLPSRARRKVKTGQVIVSSIEGSLNSCAIITQEYHNALCSTGFFVIESDNINSETLLVLFKSPPMQSLMKKRCSGTILTAISKDEFLHLPLPTIKLETQNKIAVKVQESFSLQKVSKELLESAKQAVEMAIEKDEQTAMDWLSNL